MKRAQRLRTAPVSAAPVVDGGGSGSRNVFSPAGLWRDVTRGTTVRGPVTPKECPAPLGVTPAFVNLTAAGAAKVLAALTREDAS
ncbi:hypothetical protein OHB00_43250 [Streptomyces sp. NBC_00631]|uniref:hypothetical protein n=1 Tax=Streptomyces sp. NBC_00631 TaxID=2975793 RepID=UPI0030DE4592